MKPLRTIAVAGAAAAALLVAQAVTAFAYEQHDPAVASLTLRRVRPRLSTTASPLPIRIALRSWPTVPESPVSPEPHRGAVGVHYVKGDLVKNPMIDPEHPEALVYAPDAHGGLHLAALEYVVIKSDWDAHNLPVGSGAPSWVKPAPPNLFGQDFNFTDTPNRYGLPPFYSLHAWVWKSNSAGTSEMWNPGVHCDPPALGRQR